MQVIKIELIRPIVKLIIFSTNFIFCFYVSVASAQNIPQTISVTTTLELYSALKQANEFGNTRIMLTDGIYKVQKTLNIRSDNVTLMSKSGNRNKVVISGQGMRKTKAVDNLIRVSGKHFTLDGITLQQAGNHLIQIAGEQNADFPTLKNCVLRDGFKQLLKVSYNHNTKVVQ